MKRFRSPRGHGIAGLVAATGQPMATFDVQHGPRRAADIARSIGEHSHPTVFALETALQAPAEPVSSRLRYPGAAAGAAAADR